MTDEATVVEFGRLRARPFGDYLVVERIATGGMGTVDLAVHAPADGIERPVALKRLRADRMSDPTFTKMFVDEVRIAGRISHPHVVPLLDAGVHQGSWYYAMDLLYGVPFSQVHAHLLATTDEALTALWPAVVMRIIADACEGLHAAHELRDEHGAPLDVVHRDISPQNLFLGFDGAVRVIDFGIASARDRLQQTQTGQLRGKAAYIAPERLVRGTKIDRRVDVWALGVTMWEALTGDRLFMRDNVGSTFTAIREGRVPPVSGYRAGVPGPLEGVLRRALATRRDDRYSTTREMGKDILQVLAAHGPAVDLADISEWMNELLPDAARRQRRLAELMTRVRRDSVELDPSEPYPIPKTEIWRGDSGPSLSSETLPPAALAPSVPPASGMGALMTAALALSVGLLGGAIIASLVWAFT